MTDRLPRLPRLPRLSRLPRFDTAHATPEQKAVLDEILSGPRGNLNGPFLGWIYSPELAQQAQRLGAFCRYRTGLPLRLSELAILVTAARWQAQAEWYIHVSDRARKRACRRRTWRRSVRGSSRRLRTPTRP